MFFPIYTQELSLLNVFRLYRNCFWKRYITGCFTDKNTPQENGRMQSISKISDCAPIFMKFTTVFDYNYLKNTLSKIAFTQSRPKLIDLLVATSFIWHLSSINISYEYTRKNMCRPSCNVVNTDDYCKWKFKVIGKF